MKKRITQEDINFSRMFCFESSEAPKQQGNSTTASAGESSDTDRSDVVVTSGNHRVDNGGLNVDGSIFNETPINKKETFDTSEFKNTLNKIKEFPSNEEYRLADFEDINVLPYTQGVKTEHPVDSVLRQKVNVGQDVERITPIAPLIRAGGGSGTIRTGSATTADNGLLSLNTDGTPTYDVKPVRKDLGNGMFRYKVLVNGKEMSADDALEKKLIDQKQHDEITKQNSIVDRSQETASNRMRDMWIRKGEKMSDWWKRLDDEQKMGLIGGGFLGGGLLLSNMNKKKRGLGDYISHYGIPAAIAGLSVYGGSAWNADENTYNLDRYNYLMQQAQPQQPNTTATA